MFGTGDETLALIFDILLESHQVNLQLVKTILLVHKLKITRVFTEKISVELNSLMHIYTIVTLPSVVV